MRQTESLTELVSVEGRQVVVIEGALPYGGLLFPVAGTTPSRRCFFPCFHVGHRSTAQTGRATVFRAAQCHICRIIEAVKTTWYFEERVLKIKRPYLRRERCEAVVRDALHSEVQSDGRVRPWAFVEALGKYLRLVTLEDGETIHNAMPDRRFKEPTGTERP